MCVSDVERQEISLTGLAIFGYVVINTTSCRWTFTKMLAQICHLQLIFI